MSEKKKSYSWTGVIKYKHPDGQEDSICVKCYGVSMYQAKFKFYELLNYINNSIQLEALVAHEKEFGVKVPKELLETKNAVVVPPVKKC